MSQHIPDFSTPRPSAQAPQVPVQLAPRSGRQRLNREPRRTRTPRGAARGPGGAVIGGLVAAGLAIAGGAYLHFASAEPTTPKFVAAPPAAIELRQACLDSSRSVDADGMLAQQAAAEVVRQIQGRADSLSSPVGTETTEPVAGVRLTTRVVRSDSYQTDGQTGFVERIDVPAISGLAEGRPAVGSNIEATAGWADAKAKVEAERTAAGSAYAGAAVSVEKLLKKRSNGSDVIGCVGAALEAGGVGTTPSLLVVSDLKDSALANADGSARNFTGGWAGATAHIVLACPNGRQHLCDRTARAFTDRLAKLGITDITIYRPERLDEAVTAWMAPNSVS